MAEHLSASRLAGIQAMIPSRVFFPARAARMAQELLAEIALLRRERDAVLSDEHVYVQLSDGRAGCTCGYPEGQPRVITHDEWVAHVLAEAAAGTHQEDAG